MNGLTASLWLLEAAQYLFVFATVIFALSAIDDFYFDARFYLGRLWHQPAVPETTDRKNWFAIMVPAWQEAPVLFESVANMVSKLNYDRVHIFIGTYPNDPDTGAIAETLARRFPNVHKVVTTTDGPTCKADCLNHICDRVDVFEQRHSIEFDAVILQDAEDLLHPEVLNQFNALIPEYDIVQIPVFSLSRPWPALTAGHYMDEFAESHSKDLFTRQNLSGIVPGAGVGTAYSRKALQEARKYGHCFHTGSLTEDYEFSLRLRHSGLKQHFVRSTYNHERASGTERFIATRELFPSTFKTAVRQKTRWNLGIAFQGWQHFGWDATPALRYLFLRDRKVIALAISGVTGILSLLLWSASQALSPAPSSGFHLPPLLDSGNPLWILVYLNTAAIGSRLLQRHYWTWSVYGWSVLPTLTLRFLWSGLINQAAAIRALWLFGAHQFNKKPLGWDKTSHDFPHISGLEELGHKLGESLITSRLISRQELVDALTTQQQTGQQLGRILLDSGILTEKQLMETLGKKYRLQTDDIDPFQIPADMYEVLPFELMRKHQVIPVRWQDKALELATAQILSTEAQEELEAYIAKPVRLLLVTQASLFFSLHTFSRLARKGVPSTSAQFNTRLLKSGPTPDVAKPASHAVASYMPFGQYLIKSNRLTPKSLESALADAAAADKTLGQHLVDQGLLGSEERDSIVLKIENQYRTIVEDYLRSLHDEQGEKAPKSAQG